MLFHIALRSLCEGSEERLYLQEPIDPFSKVIDLTDTSPAFTQQYLAAFRSELPELEETALLQDRLDTGWLAWGKTMEVSRLSGWDEMAWKIDQESLPGIDLIKEIISQDGWWQHVSGRLPCLCELEAAKSCSSQINGPKRISVTTPPRPTLISFWPQPSSSDCRSSKPSSPSSSRTSQRWTQLRCMTDTRCEQCLSSSLVLSGVLRSCLVKTEPSSGDG